MPYDVAFRHQQALDPSALTTIEATLHAITRAIDDCRNAGKLAATDAGVILLARHLCTVTADQPNEAVLRRRCMNSVADLRRHPALATLAIRGVAYDAAAKDLFHSDGRKALRRLADALGLADGSFDIRSNRSGISNSGEITLHGEDIWVQLGLGALGPGHAVMYRRVRGRHDHIGDTNRFAGVTDLLAPDRLAAQIRRDLRLEPAALDGRLFA